MKKVLFLISMMSLVSCIDYGKVEPSDKYVGNGFTVIEEPNYKPKLPLNGDALITLKSKDSIFRIRVCEFDAKRQVVGDTLK